MESSRESVAGAGWSCSAGSYAELMTKRDLPFSWLSPRPLWQSRNDRLARIFGDPTNDRRRAWMRARGGAADRRIEVGNDQQVSFLVLGDTGEGDASQYATVPALLAHATGTAFAFICSDVIHTAG